MKITFYLFLNLWCKILFGFQNVGAFLLHASIFIAYLDISNSLIDIELDKE